MYLSKKCYYSNEIYKGIDYNINYIFLLYEAYNKNPNIIKELKCISNYYKNESVPTFFLLDGIRLYAKSIRMTNLSENLRYRDGDIGTYYYQMKNYNQLINKYDKEKIVKNICEVGFQLGVGAITMITSVKHNVKYYGFDIGRKYSKNAYYIISSIFSMNMIWGDSRITIPNFSISNTGFNKCDIIHIDACHSQDAIYNDIINMRKISKSRSLLLLDDVNIHSKSVIAALNNKLICDIECYEWKPYCIAKYI